VCMSECAGAWPLHGQGRAAWKAPAAHGRHPSGRSLAAATDSSPGLVAVRVVKFTCSMHSHLSLAPGTIAVGVGVAACRSRRSVALAGAAWPGPERSSNASNSLTVCGLTALKHSAVDCVRFLGVGGRVFAAISNRHPFCVFWCVASHPAVASHEERSAALAWWHGVLRAATLEPMSSECIVQSRCNNAALVDFACRSCSDPGQCTPAAGSSPELAPACTRGVSCTVQLHPSCRKTALGPCTSMSISCVCVRLVSAQPCVLALCRRLSHPSRRDTQATAAPA
jgi:hypothetical protein